MHDRESMPSLPHIPQKDIDSSIMLSTIYGGSDKPTIFMPNYGEFGGVIDKLIKIIHFYQCPKKIVCCKPGEESFYPSADEFYYDWTYDLVDDLHKWGFFSKRKYWLPNHVRAKNEQYSQYKRDVIAEAQRIRDVFGDGYRYIDLWIFNRKDMTWTRDHSHKFRFELVPRTEYDLKSDIVLSPRNKSARSDNNYQEWDTFARAMIDRGYSIGCVGARDTSMGVFGSSANSWEYEDGSSACIHLLRHCKLYVGLDTGPSHLASFMSVPMIVFQHNDPADSSTWIMQKMTQNWCCCMGNKMKNVNFLIKTALDYLEN